MVHQKQDEIKTYNTTTSSLYRSFDYEEYQTISFQSFNKTYPSWPYGNTSFYNLHCNNSEIDETQLLNFSYQWYIMPSVLWCCWLGGRKGIRPVKNWVVGCWHDYVWVKVQICIWTSWCHRHSLSLAPVNLDWFYLPSFTSLVLAHLISLGQNPRGP